MVYYVKQGEVPESRHTYDSKDRLYREELFGEESFEGPYSLIYHRNEPTAVTGVRDVEKEKFMTGSGSPHRHLHIDTNRLQRRGDIISGRHYLLYNSTLRMGISKPVENMGTYYRNATSELLFFVQKGDGRMSSSFGTLDLRQGDYICIPKGTTVSFQYSKDIEVLFVESSERMSLPQRYMNIAGQLREGTPYYERDFRVPDLSLPSVIPETKSVLVDYDDQYVLEERDLDFYDTVGWDGYLYPYTINISKMAPIVGKLHQPPPVHETFSGKTFMVGTFLPRLFDFHPRSIPISYYHNNIDTEEVLFYSSGNFMSRKGISAGSITLHTKGLIHGPQPGMVEGALGKTGTDEVAVMVEAYESLVPTEAALSVSDPDYMKSWSGK